MHWLERWRAPARRIDGLLQAGEHMASAFQNNSTDTYDVVRKSLQPEHAEVSVEIERLLAEYKGVARGSRQRRRSLRERWMVQAFDFGRQ